METLKNNTASIEQFKYSQSECTKYYNSEYIQDCIDFMKNYKSDKIETHYAEIFYFDYVYKKDSNEQEIALLRATGFYKDDCIDFCTLDNTISYYLVSDILNSLELIKEEKIDFLQENLWCYEYCDNDDVKKFLETFTILFHCESNQFYIVENSSIETKLVSELYSDESGETCRAISYYDGSNYKNIILSYEYRDDFCEYSVLENNLDNIITIKKIILTLAPEFMIVQCDHAQYLNEYTYEIARYANFYKYLVKEITLEASL